MRAPSKRPPEQGSGTIDGKGFRRLVMSPPLVDRGADEFWNEHAPHLSPSERVIASEDDSVFKDSCRRVRAQKLERVRFLVDSGLLTREGNDAVAHWLDIHDVKRKGNASD